MSEFGKADPAGEGGEPWILGLAASHNGGACLLRGDRIVAAIQEERLTRTKRTRTFGAEASLAVAYCLAAGGIGPADLDLVVLSAQGKTRAPEQDLAGNRQLQLALHGVPWLTISHHMGHAASAFAGSGFADAAVLIVDGLGSPFEDLSPTERAVARGGSGDWESISLYHAAGTGITPLDKQMAENWIERPPAGMPRFRTLGGMYSAVAKQIFDDTMEAGKVMGLAPYGRPELPVADFFAWREGGFHFSDAVPARFPDDRRWPERGDEYKDLARSVQEALEAAILELAARLRELSPSRNLCYAGGVALNCVTNERLFRESGFDAVYIPAAAEDSGTAVGAAYHGLWHLTGRNTRRALTTDSVGRRYGPIEIDTALAAVPGVAEVRRGMSEVLDETVYRLAAGQLAGWFQGGSELGPRALGHRSILADPRRAAAKADLNGRVKFREDFRPFAPMVLAEEAAAWFELGGASPESPFMLRVWPFREEARARVPAVVHVDGTGRVQTVGAGSEGPHRELLRRFHVATGVPILLNTSFNGPAEPIVETPEDALWGLIQHGLDFVVLEDRLVEREPGIASLLDLVPALAARAYTVEVPIEGGRFSAWVPAGAPLRFRVETPWGTREEAIPGQLYPILAVIDGATDGWGLLARLSEEAGRPLRTVWLVERLARLRRAAVVTFARRPR
jgi:carbamoyltransferase